jgi:lipopolysaccharide transport system ATP-binding protein
MQTITRLCSRAILLDNGQIKDDGPADRVVASYVTSGAISPSERVWQNGNAAPGRSIARLLAVRVKDETGEVKQSFDIRKPIGIEMEYEILKSDHLLMPHHNIFNEEGVWVFTTIDTDPNWRGLRRPAGKYKATAWIPGNFLSEGILYVNTLLFTLEPRSIQFDEKDVVSFHVIDNIEGETARGDWAGPLVGAVRPLLKWENTYSEFE